MRADSAQQPRTQPVEVLIAFQNVANRDEGPLAAAPYVHRVFINDSTMAAANTTPMAGSATQLSTVTV